MFQGNWTCSECGGAINELPFEPRSSAGLTCRACHMKKRDAGGAPQSNSGSGQSSDRPKVAGNWACSGCGGVISSLPFTPRDTSNLLCVDCYKKSKG